MKKLQSERVCVRGMPLDRMRLLCGALKTLYGVDYDDLTMEEVMQHHGDLVRALDGERSLDGKLISDDEMAQMRRQGEGITTAGRVRAQLKELSSLKNRSRACLK